MVQRWCAAKIALLTIFTISIRNDNIRSIFAIQRSVTTIPGNKAANARVGTELSRGRQLHAVSHPVDGLRDSFEVDASGLPVQNYNAVPAADYTYENGNYTTVAVDPRLDHTVDLHGKPFKDCTSSGPTCSHCCANWTRYRTLYGSNIETKDLELRSSLAWYERSVLHLVDEHRVDPIGWNFSRRKRWPN